MDHSRRPRHVLVQHAPAWPQKRPGQDGARPSTLFSSVLQLCIEVLSCIYVPLLLKCLALSQGVARTAHELLSRFLALPPCQVYPPRESAVVIVGGDDDVGRHLALTFSEQGCTVFALCPDQPASAPASPAQSSREAAQDASNVSALIQEWHKRIKRSGRSPRWGLLAPIVLDMNSGAQRAHAVETVDAYCATHNLHLVAVIVLPPSAPAPPQPQPLAGGAADVAAWAEVVRRCLVAPISVVHGYSKLLAAASGRVVLVLASGDQLEMRSAHLHALESAAQFLRREWGLLGIRVATLSAGPFAPASKQADDAASIPGTLASSGHGGDRGPGVRSVIRDVLRPFSVRYEDVWCTLDDIVRSRYPRERYVVGLHAALEDVYQALPAALHLCLLRLETYHR